MFKILSCAFVHVSVFDVYMFVRECAGVLVVSKLWKHLQERETDINRQKHRKRCEHVCVCVCVCVCVGV